jgi:hypothetical protein
LKSSSTLNMPIRFIAQLLGRQICLASDLCTTATSHISASINAALGTFLRALTTCCVDPSTPMTA